MKYSEQEKRRFLEQALSPKTAIICGTHFYNPGGPKMPTEGCPDCWFAFFIHQLAKLPPHLRQEKLDELEMVVRTACETDAKGNFDFKPYKHPKVVIEKGNA